MYYVKSISQWVKAINSFFDIYISMHDILTYTNSLLVPCIVHVHEKCFHSYRLYVQYLHIPNMKIKRIRVVVLPIFFSPGSNNHVAQHNINQWQLMIKLIYIYICILYNNYYYCYYYLCLPSSRFPACSPAERSRSVQKVALYIAVGRPSAVTDQSTASNIIIVIIILSHQVYYNAYDYMVYTCIRVQSSCWQ